MVKFNFKHNVWMKFSPHVEVQWRAAAPAPHGWGDAESLAMLLLQG